MMIERKNLENALQTLGILQTLGFKRISIDQYQNM